MGSTDGDSLGRSETTAASDGEADGAIGKSPSCDEGCSLAASDGE